jgi:hypothetical protein
VIAEESVQLGVDVTQWNYYGLNWRTNKVEFFINSEPVFVSHTSPAGPLGLVIWLDNQYASFTPSGEIKTGVIKSSSQAWLEIEGLKLEP